MRWVVAALALAAAGLLLWLLAAPAATAAPQPPQPPQPTVPATPSQPVPVPSPTGTPGPASGNPLDRLGDAATGTAADLQCKRPPAPGKPDADLAGWIDDGPGQRGSGLYSTYGYGGWQPVIYDPGCPVSLDGGLRGAEARIFDGRNETASLYMQTQLTAVALAAEAVSIVFSQDGIWALLTPITSFLRWGVGARWWVLFGALALAATGVYWLLRARRGDVAEASASSARSAVILAVGGACLALTVTAGALVSEGVSAFYEAMSEATVANSQATQAFAGDESTTTPDSQAASAGTADAVLGDMLMSNVVYPSWVMLHFGNDQRAADEFGQRLFAAGALTRDEAARAGQDPAYASSLTATKKAEYVTVASQYQAAHPDTYNRYLAGNDTTGRPSAALAGLLGCIPIVVFLVWSLWWMGTLRIVIDLALALAPAGALLAQFPRAQWLATGLVKWLTVYLVTAVVATTLFVVLVAGGVGGILTANAANSSKVIAMFVLLLLGRAVWRRRAALTDRTGASRDSERVAAAMDALREEYRNSRPGRPTLTGEHDALPAAVGATAATAGTTAPIALTDAEPRRIDDPATSRPSQVIQTAPSTTEEGAADTDARARTVSSAAVTDAPISVEIGGTGGVPFDSFDEAARERAARRIEAARAATSGTAAEAAREQLERPRRLDPLDWPTDRHTPHVAEVPDSPVALSVGTVAPHRLEAAVPVAARREVNADADTAAR